MACICLLRIREFSTERTFQFFPMPLGSTHFIELRSMGSCRVFGLSIAAERYYEETLKSCGECLGTSSS
jgi:hypothetical protein